VQAAISTKYKLGLETKNKTWHRGENLADELHKPVKRKFPRHRVISNEVDHICSTDLVKMQKFCKWNKGYRYLLMVLEIFPDVDG